MITEAVEAVRCPSCMGTGSITHVSNSGIYTTVCELCGGQCRVMRTIVYKYERITKDEPQYTVTDANKL